MDPRVAFDRVHFAVPCRQDEIEGEVSVQTSFTSIGHWLLA